MTDVSAFEVLALSGDRLGPEVPEVGIAVADAAAGAGIRLNIRGDLLHGACRRTIRGRRRHDHDLR